MVCDGLIYGVSPNIKDCEKAVNFFVTSDAKYTWAKRPTGHAKTTVPLPFTIMGSKLVDIIYADYLADTRYRCNNLLPPANAEINRRVAHARFDDVWMIRSAFNLQGITNARLPTEALQASKVRHLSETIETSRTRHLIVALELPSNPNVY